ncbi:MAG: monovalent cation/H(+) antiporter subunit G [Hyphomonadaceae bacterium]|nr:monovalent cation/H(+) antiporter subunit G [Hyphomonadaceae bacterium]
MSPTDLIAAALAALGVAGLLVSGMCLIRFPDFYTRVHAVRLAGGIGAPLVCAGLALANLDGALALKLAVLAAITMLLASPAAHILASAAHGAGLAPLSNAGKRGS